MACLWLVAVVLHISPLFSLTNSCSFPPGKKPPRYSMEQTLTMAPIVVSGTVTEMSFIHDFQPNDTFQVSCVFKSGGVEIPRVAHLLEVGFTSCDGTWLNTGQSYIAALMPAPQHLLDELSIPESETGLYFKVSEPDLINTAAFEVNEENLAVTSQLCGMDNVFLSLGDGSDSDHTCPAREVTDETCLQASGASQLINFRTRIFPTNFQLIGSLLSFGVCCLTAVIFVV